MSDDLSRELRERLGRATLPTAPSSLRDEIKSLRSMTVATPIRRRVVRPPLLLVAAALLVSMAVVGAGVGGGLLRQPNDPHRDLSIIGSPSPSSASLTAKSTASVPPLSRRSTPRLVPGATNTPRADLCPGATQLADIWDTSVAGNAMSNWTHGDVHPLDAVGGGAVAITVAVPGGSTEVRILDPLTSRSCLLLELPDGVTADATWSPSGDALAIATSDTSDHSLYFWSAMGTTRPMVLDVVTMSWSPDGSELAIGSTTGMWIVPSNGGAAVELHCDPPGQNVECPAFPRLLWSPSGDRLVMAGGDRMDSSNYGPASMVDPVFHVVAPVPGLEGAMPIGWLDSQTLVEASDSQLFEVPVDDRTKFRAHDQPPPDGSEAIYSSDQRLAAFGSFRQPVRILDVATRQEKVVIGATQFGNDVDYSLAWSSDNRSLVVVAEHQVVNSYGIGAWIPLGFWVVNADGSGLRKLMTGDVGLVSTGDTEAQQAAERSSWVRAVEGPGASPRTP